MAKGTAIKTDRFAMKALFRINFSLGAFLLLLASGLWVLGTFWKGLPAKMGDHGLLRVLGGCGLGLIATALVFFKAKNTSDPQRHSGEPTNLDQEP
jgi:phosphate/sulfate permease